MKTFSKFLVGVGVVTVSLGFTANAAQSSAPRPGSSAGYNSVTVTSKGKNTNHQGTYNSQCPICREMQRKGQQHKGQHLLSDHFQHQKYSNSSFCPICGHYHKR